MILCSDPILRSETLFENLRKGGDSNPRGLFRPYLFSKEVHSTALTPLRDIGDDSIFSGVYASFTCRT